MQNERAKNTTRNIFWGLVNKVVALLLPLVSRTLLIYCLGTEYLGLDSLFASILQTLNIAELGFSSAIVFNMYEPLATQDTDKICALLKLYRSAYRIIGAIILCAGLACSPLLPYIIKDSIPSELNIHLLYFIFLGNTVIGYWLCAYKKSLISANQREDLLSNTNAVISLVKLIIQVIIIVIFHNYYLYILLMPIATLAENLYINRLTKIKYPEYVCRGVLEHSTIKDIVKRIKGLMLQKICFTSRNSLDNIIISAYLGLKMVTIYGNYYSIMYAAHSFMLCIPNAMTASVGNMIVTKNSEKNHHSMLIFNFLYMWLTSVATLCLFAVYQPFMKLWMKDLLLPDYIAVMLCIYFYSLCMTDIKGIFIKGTGLWWEGRYRSVLESITNIVLNIVLGKYFGVFGIVLATIISIILINVIYGSTIIYDHYFKNKKIHIFYIEQAKYAAITFLIAILVHFICRIIPDNGITWIILKAFFVFCVSNAALILVYHRTKLFKDSLQFIGNILRKSSS